MPQRERAFFQQGVNMYVPAMAYGAGVIHGEPMQIDLGIPATASATALATGINAQTPLNSNAFLSTPVVVDGTYGRNISLKASADPGGNTTVNVFGYDYLMQPMVEAITMANGGVVTVNGNKAFKIILGTKITTGAVNAVTFSIGTGNKLGLPYKGFPTSAREGTTMIAPNTVLTNTTLGDTTDPATVTTNDPRGVYTPSTVPNSSLRYTLWVVGDSSVNASNNGGLYGIRQLAPP